MPDNGPRIGSAIRQVAGDRVDVVDAEGLDEAVAVAWAWAREGGVVLLSPAAPSFGRFGDYQARRPRLRRGRQQLRDPDLSTSGCQRLALAQEVPRGVRRDPGGRTHGSRVGVECGKGVDRPVGVRATSCVACTSQIPRCPPRPCRSDDASRRPSRPRCPPPVPRRRPPWPGQPPGRCSTPRLHGRQERRGGRARRDRRGGTGRLGERFEEHGVGRGHTELISQVALHQGTDGRPVGSAAAMSDKVTGRARSINR